MAKFESYEKRTTINTIKKDEHIIRIRIGESALSIAQLLENIPDNARLTVAIGANELEDYGLIAFVKEKLVKCE